MKNNLFKKIFFIFVIFLIGLAIYVMYKDGKKESKTIQNSEIEINMVKEFNIGIIEYDTINPILSNNRDIQYIDKLIFDSLLEISYDFNISNSLAKEFSKINSVTYLIKLKEDVFWHDGTKFSSRDVIFTIENLINNDIQSIYKENVKNIEQIVEIDDYTIKIVLKEETPFFEYMMCFPILASHAYDKNFNSITNFPVGTGQYKILNIQDTKIEIGKSDIQNKSKIDNINILMKDSMKELYNAFSSKEVDFIITNNTMYEEYIGTMGYNVTSSSGRELEYLVFNNKNSLLVNKNVRKAINHAIDKTLINYNVYNNKYLRCNFPLEYGSYLYNSQEKLYEYNLNESKNLLIQDGWTYNNGNWRKGNKILEFNLVVDESNQNRVECAKQIKEQLDDFGIKINIVKVNDNIYNNYIKNKKFDIILTGNSVSNNPDLETYFGENNLSNFENEEIRNILNEVKNISNKDILKEKYFRIEEIYAEELPFICLHFNKLSVLTNSNLKGDLSHNWYNLFYNIDSWYKVKE